MLKVVSAHGSDDLATVFVAQLGDGTNIEFVESVQPPISRRDKWVLIVSTLKGCPTRCLICDAGRSYTGKLSVEEILAQIEYLIKRRYPDGHVPVPKLKVQFARMGDPALNDAVLHVLVELPRRFVLPGLMPSISTIAPVGREAFFDRLLVIKQDLYNAGRFQMQFSVHCTDEEARKLLIPANTWNLSEIGSYGDRFFRAGDRKITLNFAPAKGFELNPARLRSFCSPDRFLVKLTPINPTFRARASGLEGCIDPDDPEGCHRIVQQFTAEGFETLLSIGDIRENRIGSNCGMYVGLT
jgi:23S rRNA (adenine2503-C2)-methyltransferase